MDLWGVYLSGNIDYSCEGWIPTSSCPASSPTVPTGSYWLTTWYGDDQLVAAHPFPIGPTPQHAPGLDNGFILVEPDHKSYLRVDGGFASPGAPGYQSTATGASQLSKTLGFGDTTLLQPGPTTVFKAGSVIALYDDTPDMGGAIDATALVSAAQPAGVIDLNWSANVVTQ